MTDTANPEPSPSLLDARFIISLHTPNRGCGGTDGDVFLILKGNGVQYPPPGKWYRLDNDGDDRERGDTDSYWLESGSMRSVHTCRLYFVPKGSAPAWQLTNCSLNKWKKHPILGRWQLSEFRNRWSYNTCLRQKGWYSRIDRDLHSAAQFHDALDLHAKNPELFASVVELALPADQEDIMGVTDNRPSIMDIPESIDLDFSPEDEQPPQKC